MILENKVALITGTNNPEGIGAAIARSFANEGAKLVLIYKKLHYQYDESETSKPGFDRYYKALAGNTDEVERELKNIGADYLIIEDNITRENAPEEIFNKAVKHFGKVDILINNAAEFSEKDSVLDITASDMDRIYQVNTKATVLLLQKFVKNYIFNSQGSGRIINFSTDASQNMAGQIIYGATKAANESLTRSIATEVGKYGITVNCIAPGPTQTGWIDQELEKAILPDIPTGKLIQPNDIAETALFLCSDGASQITGQVIKVSGGHNI